MTPSVDADRSYTVTLDKTWVVEPKLEVVPDGEVLLDEAGRARACDWLGIADPSRVMPESVGYTGVFKPVQFLVRIREGRDLFEDAGNKADFGPEGFFARMARDFDFQVDSIDCKYVNNILCLVVRVGDVEAGVPFDKNKDPKYLETWLVACMQLLTTTFLKTATKGDMTLTTFYSPDVLDQKRRDGSVPERYFDQLKVSYLASCPTGEIRRTMVVEYHPGTALVGTDGINEIRNGASRIWLAFACWPDGVRLPVDEK